MSSFTVTLRSIAVVLAVWIITIAAAVAFTWIKRGSDKDLEWTTRLASSPTSVTTTTTTIKEPQPPSSGVSQAHPVNAPPKPAGHAPQIFSVDSIPPTDLQPLIELYTEPVAGTITTEALGRLDYIYRPITRDLLYEHVPPERERIIDSVMVTTTVMVPRPWWEVPAYVAGGILVGVLIDRGAR